MNTLTQIKLSIESLAPEDREAIAAWLPGFIEESGRWSPGVKEPQAAYAALPPPLLTVDEYFALEDNSQTRHEYINGVIYAMTGATRAHNAITIELTVAIHEHLRGGPCAVFSEALKLQLKIGADEMYYYPDVMVACERDGWGPNFIHNPKLIIEVLSPSTQRIDLREKAQSYRALASVEEYVVVAQNEPKITIQRRAEDWTPHLCRGVDAMAEFRSIGLSVSLADIFGPILS